MKLKIPLIAGLLTLTTLASGAQAQNYSTEELTRRTIERRAVEAVNWGMSAVNYDLMLQEMLNKTSAKPNSLARNQCYQMGGLSPRMLPCKIEGRAYSLPTTGTGMPLEERFGHAPVGACFQALSSKVKLPVS